MKKTILLFGFDKPADILPVVSAAAPFGAEVRAVSRGDYGRTLETLLTQGVGPRSNTGGAPVGRMMVLCGLSDALDALLSAFAKAGAPPCLKAALTDTNRRWTPMQLYTQLRRERESMGT